MCASRRPGVKRSSPAPEDRNEALRVKSVPSRSTGDDGGRGFKGKAQLEVREARAHKRRELVSCPTCTAQFTTRHTLDMHLRSVHSSRRIKCLVEGCGVTFSRPDNMLAHMRTYHPMVGAEGNRSGGGEDEAGAWPRLGTGDPGGQGAEAQPGAQSSFVVRYQCHQCQKTYSTRSYLNSHKATVHGGVRFRCPQCDKAFNSRGYLRRHFVSQHPDAVQDPSAPAGTAAAPQAAAAGAEGDAPPAHSAGTQDAVHKCEECSRNFASLASLSIHRYSMHHISAVPAPTSTSAPTHGAAVVKAEEDRG